MSRFGPPSRMPYLREGEPERATHERPPTKPPPPPAGPLLHTLTGHRGCIWAVAITADGKRAVSGSDDTTLKVWDLELGKELATLSGHSMSVSAVAIAPDGRLMVSGSEDATLKVWDLERGQELVTLSGHSGAVWAVAIMPDGKHVISGSADGSLKLWNLESGQETRTLSHGGSVWAVAVMPDGTLAVSGSRDGTVRLWELASGELLAAETWSDSDIRAAMIVPRERDAAPWGDWWRWWPESELSKRFTVLLTRDRNRVMSPDGDCRVAAGEILSVVDLKRSWGGLTHTGHRGVIRAVAVTPDGRRAVTGASDWTLRVWDLERVPFSVEEQPRPRPLPRVPGTMISMTRPPEPVAAEAQRAPLLPAPRFPRADDDLLWAEASSGGLRMMRSVPSSSRSVDSGAPGEPVRLGASAPRRVRPGQEFTARLVAYNLVLLRQARKALRQRGVRMHENLVEVSWQTGVNVRVILTGTHLVVEPATQEFTWEGKLHAVDFDVRVPGDIEEDKNTRLKFDVFVVDVPGCEAVPVARLRLDLEIRPRRNWFGRPRESRVQFMAQPAFQTAFASYHEADRPNVLTRLDAIQQLTGMRFFCECLSLDPRVGRRPFVGEQIRTRDLFLLFWSRRAAESCEIEWEWRTALEYKGLEAMQAQRLEREPLLPPELEPLDRTADGQNLAALGTALASTVTRKSKIVFLAASPASGEHRALDREAREIAAKIRAAAHRDALAFETRWAVRPDDLLQALNEDRPAVVHFSGHGSGASGIALHDDVGGTKLVTADALQRLFTTLRDDIRLVVLNACYSHEQAGAVAEVIDCVIGMSDRIGDDAARAFAASFYRALGFGRSVQSAFDQGLAAIALEGLEAEHVPRLLARAGVDPGSVYIVNAPGAAARDATDTGVRAGH
jgi:WD40 repeat protein